VTSRDCCNYRRTVKRSPAAAVFVCFAFLAIPAGHTAQDDARLNDLFAQLKDARSDQQGTVLTNRIWAIWREHEDIEVELLMHRGFLAVQANQVDDALILFDHVVARAPGFAEAWNMRATVRYMRGEYAASIRDVERTLELEPRHFGALAGLGLVYATLRDYDAALEAYRAAFALNPYLSGVKANIRLIQKEFPSDGQ
jgi:tetratricopeptide (TPR) repeat protein